jgi:hypothetical protein
MPRVLAAQHTSKRLGLMLRTPYCLGAAATLCFHNQQPAVAVYEQHVTTPPIQLRAPLIPYKVIESEQLHLLVRLLQQPCHCSCFALIRVSPSYKPARTCNACFMQPLQEVPVGWYLASRPFWLGWRSRLAAAAAAAVTAATVTVPVTAAAVAAAVDTAAADATAAAVAAAQE